MDSSTSTFVDRALQRRLLETLAHSYPASVNVKALGAEQTDPAVVRALAYLDEHGLVRAERSRAVGGPPAVITATITANGLDFLEDDGGLGAILNVVTVRLDAGQLRQIIASRIDAADLPEDQKDGLRAWLRQAGKDALGTAVERLVGAALDQGPAAWQLLMTLRM